MSKFEQLCSFVVERAETAINEAQGNVYYGLNPEFDSSKLTGFDQVVANFLETKPATADEIVDVIQRNSEDPTNRTAAIEILRNLVDANVITPNATPNAVEGEPEGEPDPVALAKEPEVDVTEPVAAPVAPEDEEEETTGSAIPPPEEDESDTFEPAAVGNSRIEKIAPPADDDLNVGDEDDLDDTPTSELVRKDKQKMLKKQQQMANLVRYVYQKRGKSPEEAQAQINRLQQKAA